RGEQREAERQGGQARDEPLAGGPEKKHRRAHAEEREERSQQRADTEEFEHIDERDHDSDGAWRAIAASTTAMGRWSRRPRYQSMDRATRGNRVVRGTKGSNRPPVWTLTRPVWGWTG